MTTTAPDLDALIASGDIETAPDVQRDARMRALWREADRAIRADVGLVNELAKASSAAYAASSAEEREARRERGRAAARAREAKRARAAQDSTPATV